ncbi:hypothetical protein AVEN_224755-1 [Araneus ventricosus]|uniref:Uncharacterized protein n=1 Tax=Araneus ventricosus TaxID=182803 RepID=A0A4Y2GUA7_ARAVE|nr:hypothetical protein AVEN_224755-1 [Araneus ventricosus]
MEKWLKTGTLKRSASRTEIRTTDLAAMEITVDQQDSNHEVQRPSDCPAQADRFLFFDLMQNLMEIYSFYVKATNRISNVWLIPSLSYHVNPLTEATIIPRFLLPSVIVDFFREFSSFPLDFIDFPRDLAANFAKTNGKGESSDNSEAKKFESESKDCVEISVNKSPTVVKLTSFGQKCRRGLSLHRRKKHCQNIRLRIVLDI